MKFTPDSSKLVMLLTNVRVTLFIHDTLHGTLISDLADVANQLESAIGTFGLSDSALYFIG